MFLKNSCYIVHFTVPVQNHPVFRQPPTRALWRHFPQIQPGLKQHMSPLQHAYFKSNMLIQKNYPQQEVLNKTANLPWIFPVCTKNWSPGTKVQLKFYTVLVNSPRKTGNLKLSGWLIYWCLWYSGLQRDATAPEVDNGFSIILRDSGGNDAIKDGVLRNSYVFIEVRNASWVEGMLIL